MPVWRTSAFYVHPFLGRGLQDCKLLRMPRRSSHVSTALWGSREFCEHLLWQADLFPHFTAFQNHYDSTVQQLRIKTSKTADMKQSVGISASLAAETQPLPCNCRSRQSGSAITTKSISGTLGLPSSCGAWANERKRLSATQLPRRQCHEVCRRSQTLLPQT